MQRPMGRRSRTPEAKNNRRGVTPSPPRRKKKEVVTKKEERYSSEREAFTPPPQERYRRYVSQLTVDSPINKHSYFCILRELVLIGTIFMSIIGRV